MFLGSAHVLCFIVSSILAVCLGFHNGKSPLYINSQSLSRQRPESIRATTTDNNSVELTRITPCKELYQLFQNGLISFYSRGLNSDSKTPLVISCSGGVDSMALVHSFGVIKSNSSAFVSANRLNCIDGVNPSERVAKINKALAAIFDNVHVLYLDHAMRDDTDKDVKVVEEACDLYGFKFHKIKRNVNDKDYKSCKEGFQSWARAWRRKMIRQLVHELANVNIAENPEKLDSSLENLGFDDNLIGIVFMGHHANDNVETMILKLVRGVNLHNLSAIAPCTILEESSDNIALFRPFINIPKLKLEEFMQHHEDSSNATFDYKRNYVRANIVPNLCKTIFLNDDSDHLRGASIEILNQKFRDISEQAQMTKSSTEFQLAMFKAYLHSKYDSVCWGAACEDSKVPKSTVEAFINLYSRLYNAKHRGIQKPTGLRSLGHFKRISLPIESVLLIDEWQTLETRFLRLEALWDFLQGHKSQQLTHRKLVALADKLEATPNANNVKMYQLHKHLWLKHQGFFLKVSKYKGDNQQDVEPPRQLFEDSVCTFRVFDGLNTSTREISSLMSDDDVGPFSLQFWVPHQASGAKIDFDIRLARPDDVVPSQMLWNRQLSSLLTAMQIKNIFHEDIPLVALGDTNKVVCLYGLNINTPYYPRSRQNASYNFASDEQVKSMCRCYEIKIWR